MALLSFQHGSRVAAITGAAGGMGQACARRMGLSHRLVLADVSAGACEAAAKALADEGYDVAAALSGDISEPAFVDRLARACAEAGPFGALVHTAGVSPALGDWETILRVNYKGTVLLLDAFLEQAIRGSAALCIASMAAHMQPASAEIEAIFDRPHAPDAMKRLEDAVAKAAKASGSPLTGPAYSISKRGVIRLVRDRARAWSGKGARINAISPGMIRTPMGMREVDQSDYVTKLLADTPAGRWGTPMDIANAVHFLCSEEASFITGSDLLVDGGMVAALAGRQAAR